MELRDVILSTLAELENSPIVPVIDEKIPAVLETSDDAERRFLEGIRERMLVLFEGFQSPNNVQVEAKVDLTLNFLEYLLSSIENRLDTLR
jgi:hypothetical protein